MKIEKCTTIQTYYIKRLIYNDFIRCLADIDNTDKIIETWETRNELSKSVIKVLGDDIELRNSYYSCINYNEYPGVIKKLIEKLDEVKEKHTLHDITDKNLELWEYGIYINEVGMNITEKDLDVVNGKSDFVSPNEEVSYLLITLLKNMLRLSRYNMGLSVQNWTTLKTIIDEIVDKVDRYRLRHLFVINDYSDYVYVSLFNLINKHILAPSYMVGVDMPVKSLISKQLNYGHMYYIINMIRSLQLRVDFSDDIMESANYVLPILDKSIYELNLPKYDFSNKSDDDFMTYNSYSDSICSVRKVLLSSANDIYYLYTPTGKIHDATLFTLTIEDMPHRFGDEYYWVEFLHNKYLKDYFEETMYPVVSLISSNKENDTVTNLYDLSVESISDKLPEHIIEISKSTLFNLIENKVITCNYVKSLLFDKIIEEEKVKRDTYTGSKEHIRSNIF